MENIRERTENLEKTILSPYACFSVGSRGRERFEEKCEIRTEFQRDRDRIIHSASFRRLKHKTQVFLAPERDHYRTRLTHTLEVSQIARTISKALMLNEDLTEAIALGHDLGHTPFGHAGERALDRILPGGFRHYEQSLRVVERLEKNGEGLNLTAEVRNGIVCHTKGTEADTLEGRVVRLADRIAYINHDIDDAMRAGVLNESDLPDEVRAVLGKSKSERINTMVFSVIKASGAAIQMDDLVAQTVEMLHQFMYERVYTNPLAKGEEGKAEALIVSLFDYYTRHADELPGEYGWICKEDGEARAAADYIAGMTDRYAVHTFEKLFIPKAWEI